MKKIVYVTGCLGFIGFHVALRCLQEGYYVLGVDKETYAYNESFLNTLKDYSTFKYIKSDIKDLDRLYDCDYVINCAAETHVDNSIVSSDVFLNSNINGVHKLLELIKERPASRKPIFLHFSTDEVYGDLTTGFHNELSPLKPSNPYAATKAAADMLILAWARTYSIPFIIVRPSNNYGIGQYVEKFIPRACKNLVLGKPILLHDKGQPKRTWLFVGDTAEAVMTIIAAGVSNDIYNISGNYENKNIEIAKKIIRYFFDKATNIDYEKYIDCSEVRPGQDVRYAIDDTKLLKLGWKPKAVFNDELKTIVEWYKNNFIW
jgi:dTDP-glucose 4,6-dehydratase